ncbi:hypothetical protein HanPI659440_Chr09g0315251 [Helianthus annuus]|nr:hypothetical protein HanPI659440_Chr09g0315251 [Helianthus annuus]
MMMMWREILYLSPRPKSLRYNPDRRRKILCLQENVEDQVEVSTDFDAGSIGIPELQDSCSGQESVEEARDVSSESEDESGDECGSEYDLSLYEVVYGPIREPIERLKEGDVYDDGRQDVSAISGEFVEDEAENDDSDVIQEENKTSEVVETEYVDAETVDDSNKK